MFCVTQSKHNWRRKKNEHGRGNQNGKKIDHHCYNLFLMQIVSMNEIVRIGGSLLRVRHKLH